MQTTGHSLTIVGYERRKDGSSNLLVFDPMFKPSPAFMRLVDGNDGGGGGMLGKLQKPIPTRAPPEELLRAYRRGTNYLKRYGAFEMLL